MRLLKSLRADVLRLEVSDFHLDIVGRSISGAMSRVEFEAERGLKQSKVTIAPMTARTDAIDPARQYLCRIHNSGEAPANLRCSCGLVVCELHGLYTPRPNGNDA